MDFTLYQFIIVGIVLAAASVLQCTIAFASGLFSIPVMLIVGFSLPQAVMVAIVAATFQNLFGYLSLRHEIDYKIVVRPMLLRLLSMPVGVLILKLCENHVESSTVRQIVGAIVLSALAIQWGCRVQPREKLHTGWEFLAFGSSGLLLGFCGMGGPQMVLWVMAHQWSAARSRAFLFLQFLACIIPQAALLLVMFPNGEIVSALFFGLLMTPPVMLGTLIGLRIGEDISKPMLRRVSYVVIGIIGVTSIVTPMLESAATAAR